MIDFAMFPPEFNSARMYAGPGSGPMLAAATAWNSLSADLESTASSDQSVISGLTDGRGWARRRCRWRPRPPPIWGG